MRHDLSLEGWKMPIKFVSGDLFDNAHHAEAFAHGCNCQGSMGGGIAKAFRERYPEMFDEYRSRCKAEPRQCNLGDCWLWKAEDQPWVFNLATQEGYWRARASYEAIETALKTMRQRADAEGLTHIAMPRIGVGYGGLSWKKVRAIVEAVFGDWDGTLLVYEQYVKGGSTTPATSLEQRTSRTNQTDAVSDTRGSLRTRPHSRRAARRTGEPKGDAVRDVIEFYRVGDDYGCFSNFSPHPISLNGKTWQTSEHYFQAQKFAGTPAEEEVRLAESPMFAAQIGRSRKSPLRRDWWSVRDSIMYEVVVAKFTQHDDLREILLGTGDAKIVEHTEKDRYWGDGGDGSGQNRLGQILMRVREELRR
jgi:ribA/ribD-fused uncharacterized protein